MYPVSRPEGQSPTAVAPPAVVTPTAPAAADEQRPLVRAYLTPSLVALKLFCARVLVCVLCARRWLQASHTLAESAEAGAVRVAAAPEGDGGGRSSRAAQPGAAGQGLQLRT